VSETDPKVKRSCPKGFDESSNGEKCRKETNSTKKAKLIESCEDGWELLEDQENGSQCVLTEDSSSDEQ